MAGKIDAREGFRRVRAVLKWSYLVVAVISVGATFNQNMHIFQPYPSGYGGIEVWEWSKFSEALGAAGQVALGFSVFGLVVYYAYCLACWVARGFITPSAD
jgi:hypothetical protein